MARGFDVPGSARQSPSAIRLSKHGVKPLGHLGGALHDV
jgi:hypothetical protein